MSHHDIDIAGGGFTGRTGKELGPTGQGLRKQKVPKARYSRLGVGGALFAASLSLAACGSASSTTSKASSLKPVNIAVAYLPNLQSGSALAVGIDQGFFKAQGLIVKPVQFQTGPPEISAMQAGDIQFASIGPGIMYLPMKGLGKYLFSDAVSLADSVVGNKADGVTTPASLKGKNVLVPLGSTGELILLETLHLAGLNLSDVHMINTAPNEQITGFLSNSAPAMAGWAPNTTEILDKSSSAVTIASDRTFYPKTAFPVNWGVASGFAASHPGVVKRFVTAMLEAATYRTEHLNTAVSELSRLSSVPQPLLAETKNLTVWFTGAQMVKNYTSGRDETWMKSYNKFYVVEGILPSAVPFRSYSLAGVATSACVSARDC